MSEQKIYIYVPSPATFMIMRESGSWQTPNQEATNWQELQPDAEKEVEPLIRARWMQYRELEAMCLVASCLPDATLIDVMRTTSTPAMYYPCSPSLAAKAIF